MRPEVAVFGDYHSGDTDPIVKEALHEIVQLVKPKVIILHDVFDGKSINHHEKRKNIKRALLYRNHKLSLEDELRKLAEELNELSTWADKLVIVKSNHDEFLDEVIEDGRYTSDPINFKICSQLSVAMCDSYDPLKYGVELLGLTAKNIQWLERDESYEVAGIELGAHGDKGPNGSRGSIKSLEASYGSCVIGHTHTPGILRGTFQVGTSSYLRLNYNVGPSSWMHTMCLVYPNGQRQLINIVNGAWHLEGTK